MILSAQTIRRLGLVQPLLESFKDPVGNSAGLSACGVDLTLDQKLYLKPGWFALASAREKFDLPNNVVGIIHDKSSLARLGIAVQNTVAEPGWRGYLTLEITHHGIKQMVLPVGAAIAQVVFHFLDEPTELPYSGKYQDQQAGPQPTRGY